MKQLLISLLLITSLRPSSFSQAQFALLIGIDHYAPPPGYTPSITTGRLDFPNLAGCRNDLMSMYSIITDRFDFKPHNVDTLTDGSATREGILGAMNALLQKCRTGDIAFIFYSGHGSQVKNSLSATKADKLDETIVPADTWKEGVRDIRDKELSKIFNAFIDKKIKLTVILDCCHSGSMSRGPNLIPGLRRFVPAAAWDAKDPVSLPVPEDRPGNYFLIFSAAQADEFAIEQQECVDSAVYVAHGAFTLALTQALRQESADISSQALFMAARAILKNNGASQEPVIGGGPGRQTETLFGRQRGAMTDYSVLPVTRISDRKITLAGGWALGICRGNELAMLSDDNKKDTVFKLRIDQVTGIGQSVASVIEGDYRNIRPGSLFKVTNWASSDIPLIDFYIPPSPYSNKEVSRIVAIAAELKRSPGIVWLEDLKGASPYATVFFDKGKCFVKVDKADPKELRTVTARGILAFCKKDSTLYMEIPVSRDTVTAFLDKLNANHTIRVVHDPSAANYCLFGKLGKHLLPAYGFRKMQVAMADSLESMPLVTDCFELNPDAVRSVSDSLADMARKLSKLRGWLNIITTPDGSRNAFPFRLAIRNEDSQTMADGRYRIGDSISFSIVADSNFYHYQAALKEKYVYIFAVDQSGSMALYFPGSSGNDINRFPKYNNAKLVDHFPIDVAYRVGLPTGKDSFFMLASDEPIEDPLLIFNQEGVNTDVVSKGAADGDDANPLCRLLEMGNTGDPHSRGAGRPPQKLPGSWNLKKYSFTCTY